jgi:hypothetical protein
MTNDHILERAPCQRQLRNCCCQTPQLHNRPTAMPGAFLASVGISVHLDWPRDKSRFSGSGCCDWGCASIAYNAGNGFNEVASGLFGCLLIGTRPFAKHVRTFSLSDSSLCALPPPASIEPAGLYMRPRICAGILNWRLWVVSSNIGEKG